MSAANCMCADANRRGGSRRATGLKGTWALAVQLSVRDVGQTTSLRVGTTFCVEASAEAVAPRLFCKYPQQDLQVAFIRLIAAAAARSASGTLLSFTRQRPRVAFLELAKISRGCSSLCSCHNECAAAQLGAEAVAARLRSGGRAAWAEQNLHGVTLAANCMCADANTHVSSQRAAGLVAARPPGRAA